ncbi:molybdopterin oxidoreductase family protein [Methanobacterium sp. MBAC-LM]|uniref:molybdopterin oxidoreductase family protein n=1 Tax=Methanobacterium sp. MBAC-LM TaxID=3412034 RepID=UPI003C742912
MKNPPGSIDDSNPVRQTHDSIKEVWGKRTPHNGEWPVRKDERILEEPDEWIQSACLLCSNDCGLDIGVKDGKIVGVRGRVEDRVNKGCLGPKGLHGWIANQSPERLTKPLIRKNGKLEEVSWDEAMNLIVDRSREIRDKYTGNAFGFYTTGQLFIEEYYNIGIIGKAGLGTPHMDGNTRLCTATAAQALMETFGSDGQPGSYADIDVTDTIFLMGHNMASQQTVLWMRILDRLAGDNPPKLIVVDPRVTYSAEKADMHLAPKVGTNVALMNGILNLMIEAGNIDQDYINAHTTGFDGLKEIVSKWTPDKVESVTGVPADQLKQAAKIIGTTSTLFSTVLQGVYQSMQATAAACQVNNMHLLRGLIGKPGSGILQMNGQPTAQNTRETGDDGALPAFRNWDNPDHISELEKLWNVEHGTVPGWVPPTHAMQIFRYAEQGSIKMLWIVATNPAVSLPELGRIRKILSKEDLFVVVNDAFLTETAELADVVLPAALWGEKTGTYTNTDRTVHISYKAINSPGEAKSDLDIFLDYAKRMDFRDKDGDPLLKWNDPESTFEAWKKCTVGKLVDYTGITYEKLTGGSGIQWPCNEDHPEGTERLYGDSNFRTYPDICENYGHDLVTGAVVSPQEYKAKSYNGKAILKEADYQPPHELPDDEYPLCLTTGRVVYHFHTRTKTARSEELNNAAPDVFVQISKEDAEKYGINEGDKLEVESRRGKAQGPALIGDIIPGHIFMPFHYGYWDKPGHPRAANELTITEWDPVSKQPYYKYAAVKIRKIEEYSQLEESEHEGLGEKIVKEVKNIGKMGSDERGQIRPVQEEKVAEKEKEKIHVADYIGLVHQSEQQLEQAFKDVAEHHKDEPDVYAACNLLASWSKIHYEKIEKFKDHYSEHKESEPGDLRKEIFHGPRSGGVGLVRDLHDLWLLANESHISWIVLLQAAKSLRDKKLESVCEECDQQNRRQMAWILTRIKQAAPQALVVPS